MRVDLLEELAEHVNERFEATVPRTQTMVKSIYVAFMYFYVRISLP